MNSPVLEAAHVGVTYDGDTPVLTDVSFAVGPGELVAVVGPNGAGKSTLFKALAGFVDHAGDVIIHGKHCHHLERQSIAYIPQQSEFDVRFPITVEEVVLSGRRRFHGRRMRTSQSDIAQAMACLAQVSLDGMENRSLSTLSGGQVQRVLLARALAQEADVLLLDEALSGVDEVRTDEMVTLFQDLTATGASILVSTHDLSLVRRRFSRCLAINRGLVGDGDPAEELSGDKLERLFTSNTTQVPR